MSNKTVLITGCSSGFGKLTAKKFQAEGWNVVATMRSPEKETELQQLDNVLVTPLDVTNKESIEAAIQQSIKRFGKIDAWVNNAGHGGNAILEQFEEKEIYAMFETNVFGLIRCCQAILPVMRKQKSGTIINVTSIVGHMGLPLNTIYSSTKFAVEGLTLSLALEYKPFNIQVKAVAPGGYDTAFATNKDNSSIEKGDEEAVTYAKKLIVNFKTLGQNMRNQGGKTADPQEVADKIYTCVTTDASVQTIVGKDAERMMDMKISMSQQEFMGQLETMFLPE